MYRRHLWSNLPPTSAERLMQEIQIPRRTRIQFLLEAGADTELLAQGNSSTLAI